MNSAEATQIYLSDDDCDVIVTEAPRLLVPDSFGTATGNIIDAEKAFREARLTGIGGSDAGVVAGFSPWKSAYELWLEKTRRRTPEDISGKEAIIWGNKLEDLVAERFTELTGKTVRRCNQMVRSKEHPFMIAHVDRLVVGEPAGLECKSVGRGFKAEDWGETGSDKVPYLYFLQCQHYMAVFPARPLWYLAAVIQGQETRIYTIRRDDDIIAMMVRMQREFWQHVVDETEPQFDASHETALDLLKVLYPGTNGETIELPNEADMWHAQLEAAKLKVKEYEAVEREAKAAILAAMGEAAVGKLADGTVYKRALVPVKESYRASSSYIKLTYSAKGAN